MIIRLSYLAAAEFQVDYLIVNDDTNGPARQQELERQLWGKTPLVRSWRSCWRFGFGSLPSLGRATPPHPVSDATLELMHVVDFAQAEARFAEPLRRVQAGEEVLVTRANVPVARRRERMSASPVPPGGPRS